MRKNIKICWGLIILFYFCISFFLYLNYGFPNGGQDFLFHYAVSSGDLKPALIFYSVEQLSAYPPFYHWLFSPFAFNPFVYWFAGFSILFGAIPFLIYKITKLDYSILVYFGGVSFAHWNIYTAVFPSAFVFMLLLVYFYYRKEYPWLWPFLAFFASISHKSGFMLFLLVGVAEIVNFYAKNKIFPFAFMLQDQLSFNSLYSAFIVQFPLPEVLGVSVELYRRKACFYAILFMAGFVVSATSDLRALQLSQLVGVIFFSFYFQTSSHKKAILVFLAFMFCFYLLVYVPRLFLNLIL